MTAAFHAAADLLLSALALACLALPGALRAGRLLNAAKDRPKRYRARGRG